MSIEVFVNGKEVVRMKATWTASSGVNVTQQFHELARIAHHAIDKAFKDLTTVDLTVKNKGGAK